MVKPAANELWRLWAINVISDVQNKTGHRDDVELLMSNFCEIFTSNGDVPIELLEWIHHAFTNYLKRKDTNGALEAAFGLTKKQGYRKLEKRNADIAYKVARYHILDGSKIRDAVIQVKVNQKNTKN